MSAGSAKIRDGAKPSVSVRRGSVVAGLEVEDRLKLQNNASCLSLNTSPVPAECDSNDAVGALRRSIERENGFPVLRGNTRWGLHGGFTRSLHRLLSTPGEESPDQPAGKNNSGHGKRR